MLDRKQWDWRLMFITFEGPEGGGKTTQIRMLAGWLVEQGYEVVTTREPGGTPIGNQIRKIIMGMENKTLVPEAEILLFSASRAQLVQEIIRPALSSGSVVLCDRFYDSTLAYQGYGHGLPLGSLRNITEFATGSLRPDLTILLDIDAEAGLRRRRAALAEGAEWNRMDDHALTFHRRVRAGYHMLAAAEPERWRVMDAARPREQVQEEIRRHVHRALI
ncbi:MAG: dTMP kinase [Chloroflexota bacterium]|nr:dTMP kinase [Chloroflexota bacterium]